MSEQRRGPEYVPAHVVQKKKERVRRNLSWLVVPVVGIAAAVFFSAVVLPTQRSGDQFTKLRRALRGVGEFHSTEVRPYGEKETVFREDWIGRSRRRIEYFGGQFVIYHFSQDGKSEDMIHEPGPGIVRKHRGAVVAGTALERLLNDMSDRDLKSYPGPDDRLVIETRRRKHLVKLDDRTGRPLEWQTYYFTDRGEELLSRTQLEYGDFDQSKLDYDESMKSAKRVDYNDLPNRYEQGDAPIATLGSGANVFSLSSLDINQFGDVFYVFRSPYERPFIKVEVGGIKYTTMDMFTGNRQTKGYLGEQLAIRLSDPQLTWPLTVKITVHGLDPRFETGSVSGHILGTYTRTFDRPTCFMAPAQWFGPYVADGPLFDYLRTKHYRLALVFQNMMRKDDGTMVDTLSGAASSFDETDKLKKDPADLESAIFHARTVLRTRAEYDAGRLSMARIYILLAELYMAQKDRDKARECVSFLQGMLRDGRVDAFSASEVERAAKELGL